MKYPLSIARSYAAKGWTLVELLVAMALGLLIIAGIGQIYLAAKRSYDIQNSIAQLQEVGRYATEVLTQDIRRAGYWGLMTLNTVDLAAESGGNKFPTNDKPPTGRCPNGNADWGRMITRKVVGLDDTVTGYDCLGSNWKRGDILTVRYADPSPITSYDPDALYVHTAPLEASLVFGNPANCQSSLSPPGCTFLDYVDDNILFPPGNYTYKVTAHAYYVTDSSTATQCGVASSPALPALARETLSSAPSSPGFPVKSELVTGVEQLQFQYGVDAAITNATPAGDGSVDQYFNANQINTTCSSGIPCWDQVRSVRFWVLIRGDCPEAGYTDNSTYNMGNFPYPVNDSFRRTLYTSTVALRN
jgi:type IV pilus assembly protein PilW